MKAKTYKPKYGRVTKLSNVDNRPNKIAKGCTKHFERNQARGKDNNNINFNTLIVRGTLDGLAKRSGVLSIAKKIKVEHKTDKGYFKEVYVLSDFGKRLLKNLKYLNNTCYL